VSARRRLLWPLVVAVVSVLAYALLRHQRTELVDFAVPTRAALRALHAEPLYRPEDGHYQYKYLPTFALIMVPLALPPKPVSEPLWFACTVVMAWAFVRLSFRALPDRRTTESTLVALTVLLNGKFLIKEIAFGQFNLPLALLIVGALLAVQARRGALAGLLIGLGVFVKPYAFIFVPWLAWSVGMAALVVLAVVVLAGLALPAAIYGWSGNLQLLKDWYRTVTDTTAPNLLGFENISFASMWAKWIGEGHTASVLAGATAAAAFLVGFVLWLRRSRVTEPNYLECAFFCLLVPLISPQGWDYVLLLALPAYMCLVDRWKDMSPASRAAAMTGFVLTSFTIFDLLRRGLYTHVMQLSGATVGAVLLAIVLVRLRWRAMA
jgi:hypothetical protein